MAAYLFERVARSVLVLLGVVIVAYLLVLATAIRRDGQGQTPPPSEVARVRAELGYDQPLPIQVIRSSASCSMATLAARPPTASQSSH